jgi:glycosyltransferase involved in cell wall biosynthesis
MEPVSHLTSQISNLKIGYDAKRAFLNNTGLGNYSRWLIRSVSRFYPDNGYFLYTPSVKHGSRADVPQEADNTHIIIPKNKLFRSWWRSRGVVQNLKRDGIDIYHGLSAELPSRINKTGIRSVVTVHDLIFMRFPQYYGSTSRRIYTAKLRYACKIADSIVAISERTKADLVELLDIDPQKISVIYQGCNPSFKTVCTPEQKQAVRKKYGLPPDYILNVGTVEERKNLWVLIRALSFLSDVKLVVTGKQTGYADEIKKHLTKHQLNKQVIFLNNADFADLPAIYQSARVFVYPSRYEGFGIPVLEALASGVPVIAASGSCLEEAGGPDSLYFAPDDHVSLSEKIHEVFTNHELRQKMITNGREYSLNFEDEKLAAQIMQLYQQLKKNA